MMVSFPIYLQLPLLLVVVSLVYSATRHDDWPGILHEALRWGLRMAGFLGTIAGVLYLLIILPPHLFWTAMGTAAGLMVAYTVFQWLRPAHPSQGGTGEDQHGPQRV